MIGWLESLGPTSAALLERLAHASIAGGAALLAAWGLCAAAPRLHPAIRCWIWRIAFAKLLVGLFWTVPVELPLLPPQQAGARPPERVLAPAAPADAREAPPGIAPQGGGTEDPEGPAPRRPAATAIALAWTAGAALLLLRLGRECRWVRAVRASAVPVTEPRLLADTEELCGRLAIERRPELLFSPRLTGPALLDVLRPAVVLPAADREEREALRMMLAHELAHLKRGDLLWSWLPALAHVFFYFHPLVWLGSREWRLAQEIACDELAVRSAGSPAAAYGALLVRLARTSFGSQPGLAAVDGRESPRTLERRLIAMRSFPSTRRLTCAGVLAAAIGAVVLVPFRVVAQDPPTPEAAAVAENEAAKQPADEPRAEIRAGAAGSAPESAAPESAAKSEGERQAAGEPAKREAERRARVRELEARKKELAAEKRRVEQELRSLREGRAGLRSPDAAEGDALREGARRMRELDERKLALLRELREMGRRENGEALPARERAEAALRELEAARPRYREELERARRVIEQRREQIEKELSAHPERREQLEGALSALDKAMATLQARQPEIERGLAGAEEALSRHLGDIPIIQQKALEEALSTLPGILDASLDAALKGLSESVGRMTPEQKKELRRELDRLPDEIRKSLEEARADLRREAHELTPEQRRKLEEALRRVEERLRGLPERLRKELDARPEAK